MSASTVKKSKSRLGGGFKRPTSTRTMRMAQKIEEVKDEVNLDRMINTVRSELNMPLPKFKPAKKEADIGELKDWISVRKAQLKDIEASSPASPQSH